MALRISMPSPPALRSTCCSASPNPSSVSLASGARRSRFVATKSIPGGEKTVVAMTSLETTAVVNIGQVTAVDKDTFWPTVDAAVPKIVVVDMYTQWCGPCKVIAPKFQELSEKYDDVVFLKLDCNQENRFLAKELGIKVVPTFKILKDSKIVKEVKGAKLDDLVHAIETVRLGT